MKEFFRGWRRKVGLLSLAMSLMFMGWWVRSFVVQDEIDFHDFIEIPYGSLPLDGLATNPHSLVFLTFDVDLMSEYVAVPNPNRSQVISSDGPQSVENANTDLQNDLPILERRTAIQVQQVPFLEIPFSSIVIPLTAISAFLLLTRPHKSTSKKVTERRIVNYAGVLSGMEKKDWRGDAEHGIDSRPA